MNVMYITPLVHLKKIDRRSSKDNNDVLPQQRATVLLGDNFDGAVSAFTHFTSVP